MKVAVIGCGKTGQYVAAVLGRRPDCTYTVFNRQHPVTAEVLRDYDCAIIFVPGEAVSAIWDAVMDSGIVAIWGSTGYEWPTDLSEQLVSRHMRWLIASNFSIGMQLVRSCIERLRAAQRVLPGVCFAMEEVHHTEKKDVPSGTARTWQSWLGDDIACPIEAHREGDVCGIHTLRIDTPSEQIVLQHTAKNREIFASGAIWAAEALLARTESGLYDLSDLME